MENLKSRIINKKEFMRVIPTICFFLFTFAAVSQQKTLFISGIVTDKETSEPVKDVTVGIENMPGVKSITNRRGSYTIKVELKETKTLTVLVKDIRYDIFKKTYTLNEIKKLKKDTLVLNIALDFLTLPDVSVSSLPYEIYKSQERSVADFEFVGNNFLLLTYEKKLEKGSKLLYVDDKMTEISGFTVPDVAKYFHRDFEGRINLVCESKVYTISIRDDQINLLPMEKNFFEERVKPLLDTGNSQIYFSNFISVYPAFDYYAYHADDSSYKHLKHIINEPLMDLYRAQYKYVDGRDKLEAYRQQLRTGVDKEIWIALWSGFPQSMYYKELYAPMFIKEDTILIFDHYKNKLFRYDRKNNPIDSIEINYHSGRDWEEQLIKDREQPDIYSVYQRGGKYYLKELNTSTGEIKKIYPLTYKYPEQIKISDKYVYYVYRPFESAQKKYLYREALK